MDICYVIPPAVALLIIALLVWCRRGDAKNRIVVMVIGDFGRSPRMQYHSLSLANEGREVDVVGYVGSKLPDALASHQHIHPHLLTPFTFRLPRKLFLIYAVVKVIYQITQLLVTLLLLPRAEFLILQNPPSIPTLFIAHVVCVMRGTALVIDWHNFGYTILALALGQSHPLVRVSYWYERVFGRGASVNFCVTKQMQHKLKEEFGVNATVLYDRPPLSFRQLDVKEIHSLFGRLQREEPEIVDLLEWVDNGNMCVNMTSKEKKDVDFVPSTPFTKMIDGTPVYRSDRPALIVSSTSWTEDEDFSILLDAIVKLERNANLPRMVFIITGKGPMKEMYEQKIKALILKRCHILTLWLKAEDYPRILGSADLGVSLHTSSSGVDLPMKVVDMFGCALPVCAIGFPALPELVRDGDNGMVFATSAQLGEQIASLLTDFPPSTCTKNACKEPTQLQIMRTKLQSEFGSDKRWHGNYTRTALPLLSK